MQRGRHTGRIALGAALLQILGTTAVGAAAAVGLGLDLRSAFVVGAATAISSTLLVVKILVERGELEAAHGRALVGWMIAVLVRSWAPVERKTAGVGH